MSKILVLLVAFVALLPAGAWYALYSQENSVDLMTLDQRADALEKKLENMNCFRTEMDRLLGELAEENLSLAQAVEQLEDAALKYHPMYLNTIYLARKGKSRKIQIAHNILQHIDGLAMDSPPDLSKLRARLQKELRAMCLAAGETCKL